LGKKKGGNAMEGCARRNKGETGSEEKSKGNLLLPIIMSLIEKENVFLGAGFP
jgi:hypothetical protein